MKRTTFFMLSLTLILLLSGCGKEAQTQPSDIGVLRYDGMYCYIRDFDNNGLTNNYALRFYEDGAVIVTSVEQREAEGNYFPSADWFNRENEYHANFLGSYELDNGAITLTTYNLNGSVDYKGTVRMDKLVLDSHSNINGFELTGCEYVFYSFDGLSN